MSDLNMVTFSLIKIQTHMSAKTFNRPHSFSLKEGFTHTSAIFFFLKFEKQIEKFYIWKAKKVLWERLLLQYCKSKRTVLPQKPAILLFGLFV